MRKGYWVALTLFFAAANVFLLWRSGQTGHHSEPPILATIDGVTADIRGMYTYPGIGKAMLPESLSVRQPALSMVVCFDARLDCPMRLTEIEVIKKLLPAFSERGQIITAMARQADSAAIQHFLDSTGCGLPLVVYDSADGEQLAQMGIGPQGTPFKIIYDSTFTAVYMRGADPTPESQEQFRAVAMRLSELAMKGAL